MSNFILINDFFKEGSEIECFTWAYYKEYLEVVVSDLYSKSKDVTDKDSIIHFHSFGTASLEVDKLPAPFGLIDSFFDARRVDELEIGNKISSMLFFSFINRTDIKISEKDAIDFKQYFDSINPYKKPKNMPTEKDLEPVIGYYEHDTLFVQLNGQTSWKIYGSDQGWHKLNRGDIILIPKNTKHSVEFTLPGATIATSFSN